MKTIYLINFSIFLILSACLFMLIKTWLLNQLRWVRDGKYSPRHKDRYWNRPGWQSVVIFILWIITGNILLLLNLHITQ